MEVVRIRSRRAPNPVPATRAFPNIASARGSRQAWATLELSQRRDTFAPAGFLPPMPPRPFVNDALWRCLCPRCLTPRQKVAEAGTKADMRRRAQGRKDSKATQQHIQTARKHLFKGYAISGTHVDNWLKDNSLTPIQVRPRSNRL